MLLGFLYKKRRRRVIYTHSNSLSLGSFITYDLNLLRIQELEGDHFFKLI